MSVKKLKIEYAYKTLNNDYYKNKIGKLSEGYRWHG